MARYDPSVPTFGRPSEVRSNLSSVGPDRGPANAAAHTPFTPPTINLPKGGGAIRGIGEKFSTNAATGTGSMSVPIATSPGRSGFGPELSLTYDSVSGNGYFGLGWTLSLSAITRKTDKGLPQYDDANESDVFLLSSVDELVPALRADGTRLEDTTTAPDYTIHRYRPRVEGLFARIERWTRRSDGDLHWRSISKDNVLTVYGRDSQSRVADPENPRRVFSWLICETRDDKGNAVVYEYKPEDGVGVDTARAHQGNRGDRDDPRRTANRYLKRIRYGNRKPLLDGTKRPLFLNDIDRSAAGWMFEVVFDYGEHDADAPRPDDAGSWSYREDPFSSYRPGFEVRTTRLCQRVLMFHHIPDLAAKGEGYEGLVRSTDITYSYQQHPTRARNPVYTFLCAVTEAGYKRNGGGYLKQSLPPVEFEYTEAIVQDTVHDVDAESLKNLPIGIDGSDYQWTDLHGEGVSGILTEQAGAWLYKRNLSPLAEGQAAFAPVEFVATKPNFALASGVQFMDLAGDGQPDLVVLDGLVAGLFEHNGDEGWAPFRPFATRPNRDMRDPNMKFVDLDGDGHADMLISEDDAFVWHHSLKEEGFGPAQRVPHALDEEQGPRVTFADGTQTIHLADLSGDGLTDLARIRNGEVCFWPNLGYGRFGAKVTMDHAPLFDNPGQFDPARLRLVDIDGTGTTDIIYLHREGVRLYFNQSGNSWSEPLQLNLFPQVDNLASVASIDLLGDGTACLIWSSQLPGDARRPMRYVNLMGGRKPHLLVKAINNLGAETIVRYAASTKFYLQDKRDGKPWITRLPFPLHVVERVETHDHISRNRFITRYAYHHGFFDGVEREFRGFGMVEQWDTEELAALMDGGTLTAATNEDPTSHVPPVHTKTWFHTGVYLGRERVSNFFAGLLDDRDVGEYYREPGRRDDNEARERLLDDTILPSGLTLEEEREACRALKGSMLRQEIYAHDGTDRAQNPYTVTEQNLAVRMLQPKVRNRHAVFLTHSNEAITYHHERDPADPRTSHTLTLEVDSFGHVLKEAAVAYGKRQPDASLPLAEDRAKQTKPLITYTESRVTNPVTGDDHRTPLPAEARTYELTGYVPAGARFQHSDFVQPMPNDPTRVVHVFDEEINYADHATNGRQRRLIKHDRTLYRKNNLTALLGLGKLESLALPGESYRLAFATGLLTKVFQRPRQRQPPENLIPDPAALLSREGGYVDLDSDGRWWIQAGRVFHSPDSADTAAQELAHASRHFFLTHRYRDPFGHTSRVSFDGHDLLLLETRDPLGNQVTVGERNPNGDIDTSKPGNDYRVMRPWRVMDANRNRMQVAFDTLGMVVGTAVMGKPEEAQGDTLAGFKADLTAAVVLDHLDTPHRDPHAILQGASTRLIYDVLAYQRTKNQPNPRPAVAYTLTREIHDAAPGGHQSQVQHALAYSDGFGREIQKKVQAEPGPVPRRDVNGVLRVGADGQPEMTVNDVSPRWVSSGWTIHNNKGNPVREYEPFFSDTHHFEFGVCVGVSSILFYDPIERVVATLHPNHTYEKVVFDPWRQVTYDVNDTAAPNGAETGDPRTDPDIRGYVAQYFAKMPAWQTWRVHRLGTAFGVEEQAAATKAVVHANTPTTAYFDTLGRPFLTVTHNRFVRDGATVDEVYRTRFEVDIEGNQRAVRDPIAQNGEELGRVVMLYDFDLLGHRIHQTSMETGRRWALNDVAGKAIRTWDSRGHTARTEYDPARRALRVFVTGADPAHPAEELLTERLVYGEQHPEDVLKNLRGRICLHLNQEGVVSNEAYDFKGNLLAASRRISTQSRKALDWRTLNGALPAPSTAKFDPDALEAALAPALEADTFTSLTEYDGLNRVVSITSPDQSVVRTGYNEANLPDRIEANLRGVTANGQPVWTPFVTDIDYDAIGQRIRVQYGNGVVTSCRYDPLTFRLVELLTQRPAATFAPDCAEPAPTGWPGCQVQNLRYTYDPVGNITDIHDEAQQAIFFRNKRIEPHTEFTYDSVYRLIEASGREHLGQVGAAPIPHHHDNAPRSGLLHPGDGRAVDNYVESYVYDAVGNILEVRHRGNDPAYAGWTRTYAYDERSLIEPAKTNNRLSSTTLAGAQAVEQYCHDEHGNMIRMPHLGGTFPNHNMYWNYRDQLRHVDLGGGGGALYVYDGAGQRIRKVWEKAPGLTEERIYLGAFERFRRRNGTGQLTLQRETLHILDGHRIALVETRTPDIGASDPGPAQLIRYQLGNHLGSASIELDDHARIISYEEYTPYGSTSYQAVRTATETPKRYRYSDKEHEEETGLYYYGFRYYVAWLGRWSTYDPAGLVDGPNPYIFVTDNPIGKRDPSGNQAYDAQEMMMAMMWDRMGQELSGLVEGIFGGSAYISPRSNKVEYSRPKEGVGGMFGGVIRAATLRAVPIERNASLASLQGMEVGASFVPILDPGARLVSGTTVTGAEASRKWAAVQLALDVVPLAAEARMASRPASLASRGSAVVSREVRAAEEIATVERATSAATGTGGRARTPRSPDPGTPPIQRGKAAQVDPSEHSGPWVADASDVRRGGAITQCRPGSCISASGQMVSGGAVAEAELLAEIGEWADPMALREALNKRATATVWKGTGFETPADAVAAASVGPMAAELRVPLAPGHMVLIQPTGPGRFIVRDPLPGVTYAVDSAWIERYVSAGVWRR